MLKYLLLVLSVLFAVAGQIFLKRGVMHSSLTPTVSGILQTVFSPEVFFGLVLYALSSVVWLFVLQRLSFSVAYPSAAIGYVFVLIYSGVFLKEPITIQKVVATAIIILGISLLATEK